MGHCIREYEHACKLEHVLELHYVLSHDWHVPLDLNRYLDISDLTQCSKVMGPDMQEYFAYMPA